MVLKKNGEVKFQIQNSSHFLSDLILKRKIWIWGENKKGQLGKEELKKQLEPFLLMKGDFQQISCGRDHSMALKKNGDC